MPAAALVAARSRVRRRGQVASVSAHWLRAVAKPAARRFNAREFVLVGDLDNRTNDPLLSRTIQEALTIALQQSQFVNLVSRERVAETLAMMQPPAAPLDEAAALDFCRREGIPAFISALWRAAGRRRRSR